MVYVFLADGFETVEALAVVDVLRRAGIETRTVGVTGAVVTSAHGIPVTADIDRMDDDWTPLADADMLILPGGLVGVNNLAKCERLMAAVADAMENRRPVAAICAAPTLLSGPGWLKGRGAVCHPSLKDKLTDAGAEYVEGDGVVVDDNVITGRAAGDSIDFALAIVAFLKDDAAAEAVRRAMCHGPR